MYYVAKSATDKRGVIGQNLSLQDAINMVLAMSDFHVFEMGTGVLMFPIGEYKVEALKND